MNNVNATATATVGVGVGATSGVVSETRLMWDMPITVTLIEPAPPDGAAARRGRSLIGRVFAYFQYIDDKFSTYKPNSEISLINQGLRAIQQASTDVQTVLALGEEMRLETGGYFNILRDGQIAPPGAGQGLGHCQRGADAA